MKSCHLNVHFFGQLPDCSIDDGCTGLSSATDLAECYSLHRKIGWGACGLPDAAFEYEENREPEVGL